MSVLVELALVARYLKYKYTFDQDCVCIFAFLIPQKVGDGKCDDACLACNEINGKSEVINENLVSIVDS